MLDTGRLHEETYALIARLEAHYGLRLQLFAPQAEDVGEDPRAGRWWWEHPELKECGLHRRPVLTGETR